MLKWPGGPRKAFVYLNVVTVWIIGASIILLLALDFACLVCKPHFVVHVF
jgi:hypothetical protein